MCVSVCMCVSGAGYTHTFVHIHVIQMACACVCVCVCVYVFVCVGHVCLQTYMGWVLKEAGKIQEAENIFTDVLTIARRVEGPRGRSVKTSLRCHHSLLMDTGRGTEAKALTKKAAKLGCDVSEYTH